MILPILTSFHGTRWAANDDYTSPTMVDHLLRRGVESLKREYPEISAAKIVVDPASNHMLHIKIGMSDRIISVTSAPHLSQNDDIIRAIHETLLDARKAVELYLSVKTAA